MRGTGQILHSIVHTPPRTSHTHPPRSQIFLQPLVFPPVALQIGDQIVSPKEKIYIRIEVRSSFYRFSLCSGYVLESVPYLE